MLAGRERARFHALRYGFLEAPKPETLPPHRQQDQKRPLPPAAPSPASGRRDSTPNFHAPSPLPQGGRGCPQGGRGPAFTPCPLRLSRSAKAERLPPHRQQDQKRPLPPAAPSPASGRRDSTPNVHAPSPLPQGGRGCPQGGRGPAFTPCVTVLSKRQSPRGFRRIGSKIKSALFRLRHLLPQAGEGIQRRTSTRLPLSRKREKGEAALSLPRWRGSCPQG